MLRISWRICLSQPIEPRLCVVVRYQGPKALGMPELHKLTPMLGILQDKGHSVALVTDGRMSGASGKVPAAIHLVPEVPQPAGQGGRWRYIAYRRGRGELKFIGDLAELEARDPAPHPDVGQEGCGREFFAVNRDNISNAEQGFLFGETIVSHWNLVADIGGTNARFSALLEGQLESSTNFIIRWRSIPSSAIWLCCEKRLQRLQG